MHPPNQISHLKELAISNLKVIGFMKLANENKLEVDIFNAKNCHVQGKPGLRSQ